MPRSFRHIVAASRVYFGADALDALRGELERAGVFRAVLVCGSSLAHNQHVLDTLRQAAGPRLAGIFSGVRTHSPLGAVMAGAAALRDLDADGVIAFGGGSAIVTARAASILLAEQRDILDLCTTVAPDGRLVSPKLTQPKLPQFVVPTTPTTAYGKVGAAVLHPTLGRVALYDPKTRAQALFIDPTLGQTAPAAVVRGAALNAFVMAVQGLESMTRQPLADASLIHALRLLRAGLPSIGQDEDGPDLRGELMLAALLCGQGTEHTMGALASVLGHAVGARYQLDNGVVNAILLPHTLRYNAPATAKGMAGLAELLAPLAVHTDDPSEAVAAVLCSLPIPSCLRELGVAADALPDLAEVAAKDWFLHQNPRPVRGPEDLVPILEAAW